MDWRNTDSHYGLIHIALHWLMALLIFAMFGSGLYMVSLGYYDPGYHQWPFYHKSVGMIVHALLLIRWLWLLINQHPAPLAHHTRLEKIAAKGAHYLIYLCLSVLLVSGYLLATAKGNPVSVFGWFEIPAIHAIGDHAKQAGKIHEIAAFALIAIVTVHALGAIKHVLVDRDTTLRRMTVPKR